jgi:hypothetical protein
VFVRLAALAAAPGWQALAECVSIAAHTTARQAFGGTGKFFVETLPARLSAIFRLAAEALAPDPGSRPSIDPVVARGDESQGTLVNNAALRDLRGQIYTESQ